jgi:hypothetical protein
LDESAEGAPAKAPRADPKAPTPKKAALALVAVLVPLVLGELLLRVVLSDRKVGESDGAAAYFAALGTHPSDAPAPAPAAPPKTKFRIVVMGDSTAIGFPYAMGLSFGAFLAIGLSASGPTACDWEIVGKEGRSSAGVLANLDAALALEPDLLLLYVGHNEFAQRISEVSPFGRARTGLADRIFHGYSTLFRRLAEWTQFRKANDTPGMPETFASELRHGARLLAFGDPEMRPSASLPLEATERAYHLDRFAANVAAIGAAAAKRKIPLFVVEPASSLTAPPLSSGRLFDTQAQLSWTLGMEAIPNDTKEAEAFLVAARDRDPAPIRLTTAGLERVRAAAGGIPTIRAVGPGIEMRFVDLVHPRPVLAASMAENIAEQLPKDLPHLDPNDPPAVARFRDACAAHLAMAEVRALIAKGDGDGALLWGHMYLEYGNRAGAEKAIVAVPQHLRTFAMVIVFDLALRWGGKRDEANKTLDDMLGIHPEWKPSIDWWRGRVK